MPKPSEEFQTQLSATLSAKANGQQLILWDGLVDKLLEMLMGLFDQCIGQLSAEQVAARVASASTADKVRFRTRVRKNIYKNSDEYREQGGQNVADSVFETTAAMGKDKCVALVKEMTEGSNWWPNEDLLMI